MSDTPSNGQIQYAMAGETMFGEMFHQASLLRVKNDAWHATINWMEDATAC